ncbi:hypothetical protein [Polaromonas sp.]|uniref:hypothetical protein n=1 Tax=Polaromonas sp. TaxID=1869339 RepID=UPI00326513F9
MARNTPNPAVETRTSFTGTLAPQGHKGRVWTFKQFCKACDTPSANRVQAVLVASDTTGFALHARQNRHLHCITQDNRPLTFRTIEQALNTLVDVPHLASEIIITTENW